MWWRRAVSRSVLFLFATHKRASSGHVRPPAAKHEAPATAAAAPPVPLALRRLAERRVRKILRQAADQLSNKLSHAQHLDEVTWTTKNWHGLQMQRLSVVLHTAVAWQTVNELACGDSGIVHGAKCIAVLNGVA